MAWFELRGVTTFIFFNKKIQAFKSKFLCEKFLQRAPLRRRLSSYLLDRLGEQAGQKLIFWFAWITRPFEFDNSTEFRLRAPNAKILVSVKIWFFKLSVVVSTDSVPLTLRRQYQFWLGPDRIALSVGFAFEEDYDHRFHFRHSSLKCLFRKQFSRRVD